MLNFDDSFFETEVRLGFKVEGEMKRCWASSLTVMYEVDRICRAYDIPYFADYGTLMGAVRHRGFIPWDDDIDISMLRSDYRRLMQILPGELPEGYVVNSVYSTENLGQPIGSVINRETVELDPAKRERTYGSPYICGIDIFALDYIPRDQELADLQRNLYNVVYDAAQRYDQYAAAGEMDAYIAAIEDLLKARVERGSAEIERSSLWKLAEGVASMFNEDEADYVAWMPNTIITVTGKRMKKEWYSKQIYLPFENIEIAAPRAYDDILSRSYGSDYSLPKHISAAHEYPFYKKQKEWLLSHGGSI